MTSFSRGWSRPRVKSKEASCLGDKICWESKEAALLIMYLYSCDEEETTYISWCLDRRVHCGGRSKSWSAASATSSRLDVISR